MAFLDAHQQSAAEKGPALARDIADAVAMLHMLAGLDLLDKRATLDATVNNFLWECAEDARERQRKAEQSDNRIALVQQALSAITQHHR